MSTLQATNLKHASSASNNIVLDSSGNATFAGTAVPASSFLRNRIINGDMRIDQRNAGASVTPASLAVTYTVDRWAFYVSAASKLTAQRSTVAPTGFTNSLLVTSSSAYTPGSSDLKRVMDRWVPFETASGYLWLASADNQRPAQVNAGRAYVRQHLQATAAGVDMHPLSQALQEFPEMRGPYTAVHKLLGVEPGRGTVQMLARVGFSTQPTGPTPRRDLGSMVRA